MTKDEFNALKREYDVIPFVREMSADALTPVAAFSALSAKGEEAFLFESVERGENLGRYSFVGFEVRRDLRFERGARDAVATLNRELVPLRVYGEERLPPFFGGAVGYFGYGVGGWSERIPDTLPDDLKLPDATLLFLIVLDRYAAWATDVLSKVEEAVDQLRARGVRLAELDPRSVVLRPDGRVALVSLAREDGWRDRHSLKSLRLWVFLPVT